MVARIRVCDRCVLAACFPVKLTGIYDNATQSCSVSTDKLGSGVNYDICAVLNRADQIRCSKCIVNY